MRNGRKTVKFIWNKLEVIGGEECGASVLGNRRVKVDYLEFDLPFSDISSDAFLNAGLKAGRHGIGNKVRRVEGSV
jgi:hypothetical protein